MSLPKPEKMRMLYDHPQEVVFLSDYPSLQHLALRSTSLHGDTTVRLLEYTLQFKGLRHLELNVDIWKQEMFRTGNHGCFPFLKTLILKGYWFPDTFINSIFKGSPLLKKLAINSPGLNMNAFVDFPRHYDSLECLSLTRASVLTQDDLMYIVGNSPNLLSLALLSFPSSTISDRIILFLAKTCRKLEVLEVVSEDKIHHITDTGVNTLVSNCPNLRKLHFWHHSNANSANFSTVATRCHQLKSLILPPYCPFTEESIILLSQHAGNLRVLCLRVNDCITGFAVSQVVINCRHLKHLSIEQCKKELDLNFDEFHQKSTPFGRKPLVECSGRCVRSNDELNPSAQPIGNRYHCCPVDRDIHLERRPVVSQIQIISFYDTPVSNSTLLQIAKHCPDLVKLFVSKGDIYDDAAVALVKNCERLTSLLLPGTNLTDDGFDAIATFGSNLLNTNFSPLNAYIYTH